MQQAWDDRHPDDYRTAADDAAEQAAECMADFDRREAERIEVRHECRVCHGHGTLNGRDSCWRCAGSRPNGTVMCGGRECEICGMPAQETGTEPRCEAHDSEVER